PPAPPPTLFPYTTLFRSVRKGDRVAICSTNSDAHVILLLALARIGAAMVPLNPAFGVEEMRYILADADVSGVIGSLAVLPVVRQDRKSTRLNSSHVKISY